MRHDAGRPTPDPRRAERIPEPEVLLRAVREAVSGRAEIAAAYLYGSAASGRTTPLSDVDVGLLFSERAGGFRERLGISTRVAAAIVGRCPGIQVDALDVEDLPLGVKGAMLTEGLLAASNDPVRRVEFERETRRLYFDFLPFQRTGTAEGLRALGERFRGG